MTGEEEEERPLGQQEGGGDSHMANAGPQSFAEAMREAEEKPKSVLWLVAIICGLFALGVWDFAVNVEDNGCVMTYMYEYPKYVPVAMPKKAKDSFPHYGLYVYGEGDLVEVRRRLSLS